MAKQYQRIAQIAKTRKNQGRLVVRGYDGLPFLLYEGMSCYVVPPLLDAPRILTVKDVEEHMGEYNVSFAEVGSMTEAEKLLGRYLLVDKDDIDPEKLVTDDLDVIGFAVVDGEFGELGQVTDVLSTEYQDTLVVEGQYGSVLIPYVEAFIEVADFDQKVIETVIPQGLIDLQNSSAEE